MAAARDAQPPAGLANTPISAAPPQDDASLVLDIERLLRGPPLPDRATLERIHSLLTQPSTAEQRPNLWQRPAPAPAPAEQPAPTRRGTVEVNTARTQQIRALQRRMEKDSGGGMGSRLAISPLGDDGQPRLAKTFLQVRLPWPFIEHVAVKLADNPSLSVSPAGPNAGGQACCCGSLERQRPGPEV